MKLTLQFYYVHEILLRYTFNQIIEYVTRLNDITLATCLNTYVVSVSKHLLQGAHSMVDIRLCVSHAYLPLYQYEYKKT